MSRTASEVIAEGSYLDKDFDPKSLTISQLLGVLSFHDVAYPTPYSKTKLVEVFNSSIKPNISKLKRERNKKASSAASDDGIMDGITGEPIGRTVPVRRSSRRSSRPPSEEPEPPQREPPKRRRSAEPRLGGSRKSKITPTDPVLVEESEPEEELPARKVGRSKKTSEAGAQSRRISHAEDSGWEENNIFQSGAESSSPARPSTAPRKSKSRSRMSAPPQLSPPSSPFPPQVRKEPLFPAQVKFEPRLSPDVKSEMTSIAHRFREPSPVVHHSPGKFQLDLKPRGASPALTIPSTAYDNDVVVEEYIPEEEGLISDEEELDQESDNDGQVVPTTAHDVELSDRRPSRVGQAFLWLLIVLFTAATYDYKLESAPLGYCDTGSHTNKALENLRARRLAIDECNRQNRTLLYSRGSEICPPPSLNPLPRPDACTPCPAHAKCTRDTVTCANGYQLQSPFPLFLLPAVPSRSGLQFNLTSSPVELVWKVISVVFDGFPGMGPVAFPPQCNEDPRRKRNIGVLGKAIEALLTRERGRRVCSGESSEAESLPEHDGGEAKQWGIELSELRSIMRDKTAPQLRPTFDDTFDQAIQQLVQWGSVVWSGDRKGKSYIAHKQPELTFKCAVTVKFRETWEEWRATVFTIIASILSIWALRVRRTNRLVENKRAAELVQIALDSLRHQEMEHYTDPVRSPQPYLSSLQLRDLILQDEHSIAYRKRIWDQVERVVEGNANVRVNLEEVGNGDELRVWRWVGSTGHRSAVASP